MRSGERVRPLVRQQGFTLLAVLAALLMLALSLQGVMWVLSTQAQRERELQLMRSGAAIRDAIERYVRASPGVVKRWPRSLEDLLNDQRSVFLRRHLRTVYPDPMGGGQSWGMVSAPDGGIAGVYSQSEGVPIRTGGIELAYFGLEPSSRYSQWRFVYLPSDAEQGTRP